MEVCTSLQTDNHASTPPLCFLQAWCPSCHPTNSVKALKAHNTFKYLHCIIKTHTDVIWHNLLENYYLQLSIPYCSTWELSQLTSFVIFLCWLALKVFNFKPVSNLCITKQYPTPTQTVLLFKNCLLQYKCITSNSLHQSNCKMFLLSILKLAYKSACSRINGNKMCYDC